MKNIPKNHFSRRTISIPQGVADKLRFQIARAGETRDDLLFPMRDGRVIDYHNFIRDVFKPMLERLHESEIERFTFHDLRHTHVAWLIDAGWDEYRIVKRMGWRDSRMLYMTYGHLFDNHDRALVDGLARAVRKESLPPEGEITRL